MSKDTKSELTYSSGLNKPGMWAFLFAFFVVLPVLIYLACYKNYLEDELISGKERVIKYYQRELTSFRSRATNRAIFLQQLQNFRDNCRKNLPDDTGKNLDHLDDLKKELPENFTLIQWQSNGETVASFTTLPAQFPELQARRFVNLLVDSYTDFSSGLDLQTLQQTRDFEQKNRSFLLSLQPLTGRNFPATEAFTRRNSMIGNYLDRSEVFFYWDFFNGKDNSQGGFAAIIPRLNLSPTFALSLALNKDPSANPESTNGLFDSTSGKIELSFPPLLPVAEKMVSGFRNDVSNPFSQGDWVIFVQPIAESSSANIFSMFSIRSLRENHENSVKSSQIASLLLVTILGLLFFYAFRLTRDKGLSLRKKLAWLFLLCMQLPVSILIFLGIQFSLSKERLLSIEADHQLTELVRKVDYSALDYYRTLTEWLKTFREIPELKALNQEALHQRFFKYSHEKQLQNFYLVGIDGNIEFDLENLNNEQSNRMFMRELGVKILAGDSEVNTDQDMAISEGILDQVIAHKGQLHPIIWPGSGASKFIFTDIAQSDTGRPLALIAVLDKIDVDRNLLRQAITNQYKSNPDHEVIIINANDISETIPKLSPTFKANLLPMLSTAKISNSIETDRITDERNQLLVALGQGNNIENFLIGARANWGKIVESIRAMYFLVFIGLFFSLAASIFLITVLLREFLIPVSILSSGAKSIIGGDLDLNLPVFARDELGELSETFNFMTRRLKNRLTELTVLYNMTQKASTSHNQREVFMLVAENLLAHLRGESFGTAWINEGEGEDSVYLAEHHPDEIDEAIRGVVKTALRSYKTDLKEVRAINKFVLGIPLYFEEKKFGAVYLLFSPERFKDNQGFSEDEKSFIETLRHHLALIIEKQRLFEQAITDGLTKLYVRRFFLATLEKEMARSKRYQLDVAVLLIDIDHFKKFNDTYGHQAGDMVLRETSQRLVECIRSVDTPGRYGGEEMAILLPQTNIKEAFVVAERIKKAVEGSEYSYREHSMRVTVSIGVSALHGRQVTVEEIIEEADRALYVAKDKGRNQVRIAPEAM